MSTRKIEWPTAIVIVAGIAAIVVMAIKHVDTTSLAATASGLIALTGALRQLTYTKPDTTEKEDPK